MLNGVGLNNPQYYDVAGTWQFLPQAGGRPTRQCTCNEEKLLVGAEASDSLRVG